MAVRLLAYTRLESYVPGYVSGHEPAVGVDELAEMAGRLCYESWHRPNPETATNQGYLANIIAQQHFSVLEHASATFFIDKVSRTFTHELIRHRHLSFSEVSQRYVDLAEYKLVIPPAMRGEEILEEVDYMSKDNYEGTMEGLSRRLPRKQARQAARAYLPAGLETKIVVTGNFRAWRDLLPKRLSPTADAEFQLVARDILVILAKIAPNTFQDLAEEYL